jgi:hypothetical protein
MEDPSYSNTPPKFGKSKSDGSVGPYPEDVSATLGLPNHHANARLRPLPPGALASARYWRVH